jgi:hypothetical protein
MTAQPEGLVDRLKKRAEIRRQIATRKSVQEGKPDRISDLFEEAAARIEELEAAIWVVYWGLDDAGLDPYVHGDDSARDVLGQVIEK